MAKSNKKWFYSPTGNETVGPLSYDEVKRLMRDGKILGSTAVWTEGFGSEWKKAGNVPELLSIWKELEKNRLNVLSRYPLSFASVNEAVRISIAHVKSVLFKRFVFSIWIGILFTLWLSSKNASILPIDSQALTENLTNIANTSPTSSVASILGDTFVVFVNASLALIFNVFASLTNTAAYAVSLLFGILLSSYISVKGKLLLLSKTYTPSDPFSLAWKRTIGKTSSLVFFYTFINFVSALLIMSLLYRFCAASGFAEGIKAPSDVIPALTSLNTMMYMGLVILVLMLNAFIKSFTFHFIEPTIYRFSVPALTAGYMTARLAFKNPLRIISYYLVVLAFRVIYACASMALFIVTLFITEAFLRMGGSGFVMLLAITLYAVSKLILLPLDYFFRILGTRIVK